MTKHNIQLNTLKDCLQFLEWLNGDKSMQREVAKELGKRIKQNYTADFLREHTIESALSTFLGHASHFYTRLCNNPQPWAHGRESADKIAYALLECMPKFLSVMYFLWYNVDPGFEKLHGGGWKKDWPGYGERSWHGDWGGDLDKYLYAIPGDAKYNSRTGVIPGGFTSEDKVIYNATLLDRGYPQGYSMAGDLQKIVDKGKYNYFRSVFVSSVIGESAKRPENAANSLVLARTFCDIVLGEDDKETGGKLIEALNAGLRQQVGSRDKSICWKELHSHCTKLRKKFDMLFGNKHFDFTGLSTNTGNLQKEKLAKKTADWLRTNITKVQGHLNQIKTDKSLEGHLGEYFTKNLFPYGFTIFNGTRFDMFPNDVEALKKDWREVIEEFKKSNGDLNTLREILSGTYNKLCPNVTPPIKPEAPPAKVPEGQQKSEGAQNQGGPIGSTTPVSSNQNNDQSKSSDPPVGQPSVAAPTHNAEGATGPVGLKVPVPPVSPQVPGASVRNDVQPTQTVFQPQHPPPAPPPPPLPAAPAIPGQPGVQDPPSTGTDVSGQQHVVSQNSVRTQSPSVVGPSSGSTGDQAAGRRDSQNVAQGATLQTSQNGAHDSSSAATTSVTTASGGGPRQDTVQKVAQPDTCPGGKMMSLGIPGGKFCVREAKPRFLVGNQKSPADLWKIAQEKQKQRQEQREREAEELKQTEALREKHRQQEQLQKDMLSVEGFNVSAAVEGKTLPDVSALLSQKQEEAEERSKMREQIHIMRDGDFVHASAIKPFTKQPYAARLLRSPKRSKPLPAARHKHHNVAVPDVADGMALPQNLPTKMNVPRHKFKQSHKPLEVQELDDYPIAFTQHVSGTDLTKFPAKDVNATAFQDLPQPVPQLPDFNGSPIPDSNLKSSLNPTAMFLPVPHPTIGLKTDIPERPPQIEEEIDLHIDIAKPTFQDHMDHLDIDDDSTHIRNDIVPLPAAPYIPKISFNLPPPDPQHSVPPREDPKFTTVEFEDKCPVPWITQKPTHDLADIPETELFPSEAPHTVRDMLIWLAGLRNEKHHDTLKPCIEKAFKRGDDVSAKLTLPVNDSSITAKDVIDTIQLAATFAASVLNSIAPKWRMAVPSVTLASKVSDQSKDPDCCALLCQLRDYVYACCHQLNFLRSQCNRNTKDGGWQDRHYGSDVSSPKSPLQAFLTDASDSKFKTHPFDPCDICLKSRVNMGFEAEDLPASQQTGKHISTILTPTCGGEDPLLTLSSYLNCLTRRTPRTTGELVSFFHNFGNSLHDAPSDLSKLGSALSKPHRHCPDWDSLAADDLQTIKYARGSATPNSIHRDNDHPNTLSTLLGCGIDDSKCSQLMKPITYRAYAVYSPSFVHAYLSWAVHLADRLWESLTKLHCDLEELQCHAAKPKPLHQCDKALPLLYTHGLTPPDGTLQPSLTCSQFIAKLEAVVAGQPIASLMTAMDLFLYGIREPFLFTIVTLWLTATLYIAHSLLYRMDVMHIRSHLLTTRASHLIDVKALLAGSRRMLSLYRDVDYFDDDFHS
ncbi:Ribosome-binding protein 1 [Babesia ovata]|uniref:Ribosome-binding protein 1 n=1 Tax=Babesia ovata TaxID=189622 RepID=A0A2H6KG81_9APIC|nr:Ribosome-binding protein 1 [Babesia ovata]GBE61969.1 Ribosome-binding protein 1 [Babesia ovata]